MSSLVLHKNPEKILIIKPSALGDVIHGLPFLASLRERFPDAKIHWVVAKGFHEILEDHPLIEKLWVIEKDEWKKRSKIIDTLAALKALFRRLQKERFDLVIDLQGLFRSGVIARATGCGVRIGFREAREGSPFFYTHKVDGGKDIHAIDRYLEIASFLGASIRDVRHPFPLYPKEPDLMRSLPEDFIVIAPSAGGEAKRWPAEKFGKLAAALPVASVVVAGKSDAGLARQVVDASGGKALSIAGKTSLKELLGIIERARLFVSSDTGPMHMAAALNVPVVAMFGPTNPLRTGPYGSMHTIVTGGLSCSPCYKRKKCKEWRCMEAITVESVAEAIERRLKERDFSS